MSASITEIILIKKHTMKKISLYNKNKLEKTNLLIDAEGRYEEQKKRLHDALSTVIEVEKMYEELKEDYEELKEQMKKVAKENKLLAKQAAKKESSKEV